MIFATVGTHEDPFNRLIVELERLQPGLAEPVVIQSGYSTAAAPHCTVVPMMTFAELQDHMARARVVVTHGGPASIMQALAHGKVPVVVPRQAKFGEHVDDHQVRFSARIADRVVRVLDIGELSVALTTAARRSTASNANPAAAFAARFDGLCEEVLARPR